MRLLPLAAAAALILLQGCHSAFIEAVVRNRTDHPIAIIEVDYPSASFGTEALLPNADFHYRFKVLGSGPTKVLWTDAAHQEHSFPGPSLHENDEGKLILTFSPAGPIWQNDTATRAH